jgi:hypothetical protein
MLCHQDAGINTTNGLTQGNRIRNAVPPLKERAETRSPMNGAVTAPKVLWMCPFEPPLGGFRSEPTALAVGELAGTVSNAIAL